MATNLPGQPYIIPYTRIHRKSYEQRLFVDKNITRKDKDHHSIQYRYIESTGKRPQERVSARNEEEPKAK